MVRNRGDLWIIWLMVMLMLTNLKRVEPALHKVGGKNGWKENINYTEWALHETFYVGDWLGFWYDRYRYNVLQVNETSYENCVEQDFIKNVTGGGGRDVFHLVEPKPYYFLSGGGHCYNGLKIAVNVVELTAPAPAPTENGSPAYASTVTNIILSIFFALSLILWL